MLFGLTTKLNQFLLVGIKDLLHVPFFIVDVVILEPSLILEYDVVKGWLLLVQLLAELKLEL